MRPGRSEAIEAERSILGAILAQSELFPLVSLGPEDFASPKHRTIFAAMRKLSADGLAVDLVTVKTELTQAGSFPSVGGVAYLAGLVDGLPRLEARSLSAWEEMVRLTAKIRRVEHGLTRGLDTLKSSGSPASALDDVRKLIDETSAACGATVDLEVAPRIDAAAKALTMGRGEEAGASTGLQSLDALLGPLKPGQLVIVAARPGVGKSVLLSNIAEANARVGRGVFLVSAEMTSQ